MVNLFPKKNWKEKKKILHINIKNNRWDTLQQTTQECKVYGIWTTCRVTNAALFLQMRHRGARLRILKLLVEPPLEMIFSLSKCGSWAGLALFLSSTARVYTVIGESSNFDVPWIFSGVDVGSTNVGSGGNRGSEIFEGVAIVVAGTEWKKLAHTNKKPILNTWSIVRSVLRRL
jgi:hypothetical protein